MNAEHWNPLKHKSFMIADMVFFCMFSADLLLIGNTCVEYKH